MWIGRQYGTVSCLLFLFIYTSLAKLDQTPEFRNGVIALSRSFPEVSVEYFKSCLDQKELSPTEQDRVTFLLVESYLRSGLVQDASRLLAEMEDTLPNEKHFWIALTNLASGQTGNALHQLKQLKLNPKHRLFESAILNQVLIEARNKNTEGALETLNSLPPTSKTRHFSAAEILLNTGDIERAEAQLNQVSGTEESYEKDILAAKIKIAQGNTKDATSILTPIADKTNTIIGRTALRLLISTSLETQPESAFSSIVKIISCTPPSEPLQSLFDSFLLSANSIPPTQTNAVLDEWIGKTSHPKLQGYARYTKALLSDAVEQKLKLLQSIFQNTPNHPLAQKSILISANLHRLSDDQSHARKSIDTLIKNAQSDVLKSVLLSWKAELTKGSEKSTFYEQALQLTTPEIEPLLQFNLALSHLETNDPVSTKDLPPNLEGELLFANSARLKETAPKQAITTLEEFIQKHPTHSLLDQAQLMLAELFLKDGSPTALEQAKSLVNTLSQSTTAPKQLTTLQANIALAMEDEPVLVALSSQTLDSDTLILRIADFLYKKENFYSSSLYWGKLLNRTTEPKTKILAQYYSALAKLKIGTENYKQSAYRIFESLIETNSEYRSLAIEILANAYLSENKTDQALALLEQAEDNTEVLLLKAKCYAGSKQPETRSRAISLYKTLLNDDSLPLSMLYKITYQLIIYYEDDGKYGEAIDLYYRVANFEQLPAPVTETTWNLYYRIGARGLALFEQRERWRTAYQFAKVLTQVKGPQHEQFTRKVQQLSLEHLIWEQ